MMPPGPALIVLAFVVLYKFCDAFAGAMTAPADWRLSAPNR